MFDHMIYHTLQICFVVSNHDSIICESDVVDVVTINPPPVALSRASLKIASEYRLKRIGDNTHP